jgi:hypothetical protein
MNHAGLFKTVGPNESSPLTLKQDREMNHKHRFNTYMKNESEVLI